MPIPPRRVRRRQRGAAVVDFVVVLVLLVPVFLGVLQVALVLFVRLQTRRAHPLVPPELFRRWETASPYLGGSDPPPWFDFDFLISETKFLKVIEGKYDRRHSDSPDPTLVALASFGRPGFGG